MVRVGLGDLHEDSLAGSIHGIGLASHPKFGDDSAEPVSTAGVVHEQAAVLAELGMEREAEEPHLVPGHHLVPKIQKGLHTDAPFVPDPDRARLLHDEQPSTPIAGMDQPEWLRESVRHGFQVNGRERLRTRSFLTCGG